MSRYIDGFVIPIKKSKIKEYKKMAEVGRKTWMKHGALDYYECIGAKLNNGWGLGFTKMCKLKKDETLIFAYIVYKSKSHRESVNKKVHADFAKMYDKEMAMPFDMKRFSSGEFKTLVYSK